MCLKLSSHKGPGEQVRLISGSHKENGYTSGLLKKFSSVLRFRS